MESLKAWLDRNADHFKTYTVSEIAELAAVAGIEADEFFIRQWKTQQNFKEAV